LPVPGRHYGFNTKTGNMVLRKYGFIPTIIFFDETMKSLFDEEINREHCGAVKYDFRKNFGKPADVIPLWVADLDFRAPSCVSDALKELADFGVFGYTQAQESYFEALTGWFQSRFGWDARAEWQYTIPGVMFGVAAAIRALTHEGDAILIQEPVYFPFREIVLNNQRKLVVNELKPDENGRYAIDFEAFERQLVTENVKIFLLCSPHNPVARVWTTDELRLLGTLCLRHGVKLISDEIHADFALFGNRQTLFPTLGPEFEENCILCTSPSKTFNLMGLQTANLWIPNPTWRKAVIRECLRFEWFGISSTAYAASTAAYRSGGEWLAELKSYLEGNVRFVTERLAGMNAKIRVTPHEGTYLVWLDCREMGLTDDELDAFFTHKARLWLHRGVTFGRGGSGFMRMNVGTPRSVLERAMEQIEAATDA